MRWQHTDRSKQDYDDAPAKIRKAFDKQVSLLAANLSHPSLRAKKFDEPKNVWQARVDRAWRFYFKIEGDTCTIVPIVPHPK
jgi:plasmid maintenance system killer protein